MKISIGVGGYARGDITGAVDFVQAADRLGVDSVWSAEAWGQDAIAPLAYLAAKTERIKLGTGAVIMPWNAGPATYPNDASGMMASSIQLCEENP